MNRNFDSDNEQKEFLDYVEKELVKVIERGYNSFIVEFSINVDLSVIEVLVKLKQHYKRLILGAMIMGVDFSGTWTQQEQVRFFYNLNKFDKVLVMPPLGLDGQVCSDSYFVLPNIIVSRYDEKCNDTYSISIEEMAQEFKRLSWFLSKD